MAKKVKSFGIILGTIVLLCLILNLIGNPNNYSLEQHIDRISKKVEQKYISDETGYTDFEVFPLYNENEKVEFYLVEFDPYGYMFIYPDKGYFGSVNYRIMESVTGDEWSPYKVDTTNSQPEPDTDKAWILDNNGEKIIYNRSPYQIANFLSEDLYLLKGYVPAVKIENEFLNLVSGDLIEVKEGNFMGNQAGLQISLGPPKPRFIL